MKKPFLFLLPLWLSGCVDEQYLVGYWKATDMPQCLARSSVLADLCAFHILRAPDSTTGYRVVSNGEYAKPFSEPLETLGYGHYLIHAPDNNYPLNLIDGKLTNPWGSVYERMEPLKD